MPDNNTPTPAAPPVVTEESLKTLLTGAVDGAVKAQFEAFKASLTAADRKNLFPSTDGTFDGGDADVAGGSVIDTSFLSPAVKSFAAFSDPKEAGHAIGKGLSMGNGPFRKLSKSMEQFAELIRYKGNLGMAQANGFDVKGYNEKNRAQMKALGLSEGVLADGGATVPVEFVATVIEFAMAMSPILSKVWRLPMSSMTLKIPKLAQSEGSYFGGFHLHWIEEAAEKQKAKPAFDQLTFTASKLVGLMYITDELIADSAINIINYLVGVAGRAFQYELENVVLNGSGTGQPLGVTNDPNVNFVNRTTAGTIVFDDVVNMDAAIDEAFSNLGWVSRKATIAALRKLKDSQSRPIFTADYGTFMGQKTVPDMMLGYPVFKTRNTPVLGNTGDLILGDWGMYILAVRQDMTFQQSEHVAFTTDETCLRFVGRFDGKPGVSIAFAVLGGRNS